MADSDDRHRVKRAEVAAQHTKRPWNTDLPSSHHIISALVALSQTVYSLDCDWKLATACLLSDIFFNKLAKSYKIEWGSRLCPPRVDGARKFRRPAEAVGYTHPQTALSQGLQPQIISELDIGLLLSSFVRNVHS